MKFVVEVGGIEPPSLSNQIKVATCLAPHFKLNFATPAGQDLQIAAFYALTPDPKANLPEPACFRSHLGHRQPKERPAYLVRQDCA